MSLVDVSELMSDPEFTSTIVLRRPSAPRMANEGENIASYEADVNVVAIVQPAKADEIASLPEGSRGGGAVKRIWSDTTLRMADGEGDADILLIDGEEFKVVGQQDWDGHGYRFVLAAEITP